MCPCLRRRAEMKKLLICALIVTLCAVALVSVVACAPNTDQEYLHDNFAEYYDVDDFAGIEVYCWQDNGKWYGGVMPGTSCFKSPEEINALKAASEEQLKAIIAAYPAESKRYMRVMVVTRPCTDRYYEEARQLIEEHPEVVSDLVLRLGIAKWTKTAWDNAEDKRELFDAYVQEQGLTGKTTEQIKAELGEPQREEKLIAETYPAQYGGCVYEYVLCREENHVWGVEITFDPNNVYSSHVMCSTWVCFPVEEGYPELTVVYKVPDSAIELPLLSGKYKTNTILVTEIASVTDVSCHAFLDGEELSGGNGDGYRYEFAMPDHDCELVVTFEPFYIDKAYAFDEVFYWGADVTVDSLVEIVVEDGFYGVDPDVHKPTIRHSADSRDIESNVAILAQLTLTKANPESKDGGYYRKVTYVFEGGGRYELLISNGFVVWNDFGSYQYFTFDKALTPDICYATAQGDI